MTGDGAPARPARGALHHIDLWVADLAAARASWGWLLERLGWAPGSSWSDGSDWRLGTHYLVVTTPPGLRDAPHDRRTPGVNHLAFHGGTRAEVDALAGAATAHGWTPLYAERYPHAGGPDHYAAYLEDAFGHKVEVVADAGA